MSRKDLNKMFRELGLRLHFYKDEEEERFIGYYRATEVAEKLFEIRQSFNQQSTN